MSPKKVRPEQMLGLTEGFSTKADKIRVLDQAGYARADIARFLGVRYQQVRNTLEGDKRTGYSPDLTPSYETSSISSPKLAGDGEIREIEIGEDGFAQIPPDMIEDLTENDEQLFAIPFGDGIYICNLNGMTTRVRRSLE